MIKARNATDVITGLFSGDITLRPPIIIPKELGLAKPHTAYVAIAELRSYSSTVNYN